MLRRGIGPTHVPSVGEPTLKAHERKVGLYIEKGAKDSCLTSKEGEKNLCQDESEKGIVAIGGSYDMGRQKREKTHNSLIRTL